jgi:hypothetical protein
VGDMDRLQVELQMYNNAIIDLEGKLADLKEGRRAVQMRLYQLERDLVPMVKGPYRGPRTPAKPMMVCHKCSAKTNKTRKQDSGYEVAECAKCQMDAILLKAITDALEPASGSSGAEQNEGGTTNEG